MLGRFSADTATDLDSILRQVQLMGQLTSLGPAKKICSPHFFIIKLALKTHGPIIYLYLFIYHNHYELIKQNTQLEMKGYLK